MNDFNNLISGIGTLAEISAIYYQSLVRAGLPEDYAITLTAKAIGEALRAVSDNPSEEGAHEHE